MKIDEKYLDARFDAFLEKEGKKVESLVKWRKRLVSLVIFSVMNYLLMIQDSTLWMWKNTMIYVDFRAIKSDFVKEHIRALTGKKECNSAEIRRGERNFSKLQNKNVGINSTINNFKVKNFDKIVSAVNNLTA